MNLSSNQVAPGQISIELTPDRCFRWFPTLDFFADKEMGPKTLYLFDLRTDDIRAETLNHLLRVLTYGLDHGIRNHLASYQLLGKNMLQVKRCPEVPVKYDEDAITYGRRLTSPGVMWGYIQGKTNQFITFITFTTLMEQPVSGEHPISYDGNADGLLEPKFAVNEAYFAFSSFILGHIHLRAGNTDLARLCFLHAQQLKALPGELESELTKTLNALEQSNSVRDLTPIGEEKK